jgi:hypothetical protein
LEVPIALVNKAQLPRSVSLLHATVLRCTPDRQYFLLGLQFQEPLISNAHEVTHSQRASGENSCCYVKKVATICEKDFASGLLD